MRQARLLVVYCALAILTGLGARQDDCRTLSDKRSESSNCLEPARAVAAPEKSSLDSIFVPADNAYEVKLQTIISLCMSRKKNNVHFIDARDPKLYLAGHIPGAINIPFEKLDRYSDSLKLLPKSDLQVLYCDGGDCHLSHDLADQMLSQGWHRVAVYIGGWIEWSKETDLIETTN
jgi:rhodanese-related sulfurtransferase